MDASEMIEIEMLESQKRLLETQKQNLLEENERLRSASDLREKAQSNLQSELHLLQSEKENTVKFSAIKIQQLKDEVERVAGERDGLLKELDLKNEEAEQLFLELQELERTSQEDQMELGKVMTERARLLYEKERWDDRVDKIVEDNTVIILTVLASQNDLEEQINMKAATLEAFSKKVQKMVRRTRAIIESPDVPEGGDEGGTREEIDDDEIGNVVMVMAAPVDQELKKIEAAVARKARLEKAAKANTAAAAVEARKGMVERAAKALANAAAPRKEQIVEEEAEEETEPMLAWRLRGEDASWWSKTEDAGSRRGQSSKNSLRKKGKGVEWAAWDD